MQKAYIAAPLFTKEQKLVIAAITAMLKLQEWEYFSPYEASQNIWKGRAPKDCSKEERDAVLRGNIDNLSWADTLIAWVGGTEDGRTDTGVVWEMGHFNALGMTQRPDPVVAHMLKEDGIPVEQKFTLAYIHPTDKRQSMNLMLAGTVDAITYGPAQLHDAVTMLRGSGTGAAAVRDKYHPEKNVLHEAEPVG